MKYVKGEKHFLSKTKESPAPGRALLSMKFNMERRSEMTSSASLPLICTCKRSDYVAQLLFAGGALTIVNTERSLFLQMV